MMRWNCIYIMLGFISCNTLAQNFSWAFQAGGVSDEYGQSISVDGKDNIFVTANFSGAMLYGGNNIVGGSPSPSNFVLAKHDKLGNLKWVTRSTGADVIALTADRIGNCYVTGQHVNATFAGTNSVNITVSHLGNKDSFVAKYDSSGKVLWVKSYGYNYSEDKCIGVSVDLIGNIVVTGTCFYQGYGEFFVIKYDPNGNLIWKKTSGPSIYPFAIATDSSMNSYIVGSYTDSLTYGSLKVSGSSSAHAFILKIDQNGNEVWAKKEGTNYDQIHAITIDRNNDFIITGFFSSPSTFGTTVLNNASASAMFIAKYNTNGLLQWIKTSSAKIGTGTATDSNNDILVTGWIKDTVFFGETPNIQSVISTKKNRDIFVAKYLADGTFKWVVAPGGSMWSTNQSMGISIDSEGSGYVTGGYTEQTVFGSYNLFTPRPQYGTNMDIFIAKISGTSVLGVNENAEETSILCYPNPTSQFLNVYASLNGTVRFYNVMGELVFSKDIKSEQELLDVSGLAAGPYFLFFFYNGEPIKSRKIIICR